MKAAGQRVRTEDVYESLRHDILAGSLVPGDRLRFPELSRRTGASIGALREALVRLTERGLVTSEPNLGFRVSPISVEAQVELADARAEVEALAVRRAIAEGSLEWESRLVAAGHRLARTRHTARSPEDWQAAHTDFHLALLAGCGNRFLLATAGALRERAEVYRRWSEPEAKYRPGDQPDDHEQLVRAAVARDADAAERILRSHIAITRGLRLRLPGS